MSRVITLCLPGVLLLAAAGNAFGLDPNGIEGKWAVGFNGHKTHWTFTLKADGTGYDAVEGESQDNAKGTATYDAKTHVLTLKAETREAAPLYKATYTWTMKVGDSGMVTGQATDNGKAIGSMHFTVHGGNELKKEQQEADTHPCTISDWEELPKKNHQ